MKGKVNIIISIASLLFSCAAILIVWLKSDFMVSLHVEDVEIRTDTMVGVLSILVTLLIGWNIYSAVDFNSKLKAIEKMKEEVGKIMYYIQKVSEITTLYSQKAALQVSGKYFSAFIQNAQIICLYKEIEDVKQKEYLKQYFDNAINSMYRILQILDNKIDIIPDIDIDNDEVYQKCEKKISKCNDCKDLIVGFADIRDKIKTINLNGEKFEMYDKDVRFKETNTDIYAVLICSQNDITAEKYFSNAKEINNLIYKTDYNYDFIGKLKCRNKKERNRVYEEKFI